MAALTARVSQQQVAAEGLGSSQNAVKYLGQDFETLRQKCLDSGVLFKDPEFPACPSALGYKDLGPCSPSNSRHCLEVAHGKEMGLLLSVRMEGPRFWSEVAEGEVMVLDPMFLYPIFQPTPTPPL